MLFPDIAEELGLTTYLENPSSQMAVATADEIEEHLSHATLEENIVIVDAEYYNVTLQDAVPVLLCKHADQWYMRISNQRLKAHVPEKCSLRIYCDRLWRTFRSHPNYSIPWSDRAQDYFESLALCENVGAQTMRFVDRGPDAAAGRGIAPLKI